MVQVGRGRQHAVLVVAEGGQGGLHEVRQAGQGLLAGHGEPEVVQLPEAVGKARRDEVQDLPGHGVGGVPKGLGQEQAAGRGRAVLGVEVPPPPGRGVAVHQQARPPPHVPVEVLHAQGLASLGPGLEVGVGGEEPVVFQDRHGNAQAGGPAVRLQLQPPLARLGEEDRRGAVPADRPLQLAAERAGIVRRIQPDMVDPPPRRRQVGGEAPHGRQDEDDLLPVVPDVGGLAHHLRHQHHGPGGVPPAEGRDVGRQLVPEDQDEVGHETTMP